MRDWLAIGLGMAALAGVALLARGCGGGSSEAKPMVLSPEDRSSVEAAARSAAEAAAKGDITALDALIMPGLPQRELHALRARLAALKGKSPLEVTEVEGRPGGARVSLKDASGRKHTWLFDRGADGKWSLAGLR